jgi:hypothetical protein
MCSSVSAAALLSKGRLLDFEPASYLQNSKLRKLRIDSVLKFQVPCTRSEAIQRYRIDCPLLKPQSIPARHCELVLRWLLSECCVLD